VTTGYSVRIFLLVRFHLFRNLSRSDGLLLLVRAVQWASDIALWEEPSVRGLATKIVLLQDPIVIVIVLEA